MKKIRSVVLFMVCVIALDGCSRNSLPNTSTAEPTVSTTEPSSIPSDAGTQEETLSANQDVQTENNMPVINIQVGDKNFTAILYDNETTRALLEKLPLTVSMDELNGNEKFHFFSEEFPTDSERVGNIKAGDLMLFGTDCLVLFYESFFTGYSYTRLGNIEDSGGLADAVGSGSITVTFSVSQEK